MRGTYCTSPRKQLTCETRHRNATGETIKFGPQASRLPCTTLVDGRGGHTGAVGGGRLGRRVLPPRPPTQATQGGFNVRVLTVYLGLKMAHRGPFHIRELQELSKNKKVIP